MTNRELVPQFDLADRMRKGLRITGLTVQEMADYLGVTRTTVSNWINGHIKPSTQTQRLWAMRTGVSYVWLTTGEHPHQAVPDEGVGVLPRLDSNQQPAGYRKLPERWTAARRDDFTLIA